MLGGALTYIQARVCPPAPVHTHKDATARTELRAAAWCRSRLRGTSVSSSGEHGGSFPWGRYRWVMLALGGPALLSHQPCQHVLGENVKNCSVGLTLNDILLLLFFSQLSQQGEISALATRSPFKR